MVGNPIALYGKSGELSWPQLGNYSEPTWGILLTLTGEFCWPSTIDKVLQLNPGECSPLHYRLCLKPHLPHMNTTLIIHYMFFPTSTLLYTHAILLYHKI